MTSWEYPRRCSCDSDCDLALLEDAPPYEHFFNQILAQIFEWKLVVCQLKQKNLVLSCLYMKGELLAIDKDSNKTYLCTVVPFNMACLYWIISKCYYLLSCTDGGYAKDYLLKIHLVQVSLHICNSNTCRVFLYYYYWTGNIIFFFWQCRIAWDFSKLGTWIMSQSSKSVESTKISMVHCMRYFIL